MVEIGARLRKKGAGFLWRPPFLRTNRAPGWHDDIHWHNLLLDAEES